MEFEFVLKKKKKKGNNNADRHEFEFLGNCSNEYTGYAESYTQRGCR